jgi:hypothetical protein
MLKTRPGWVSIGDADARHTYPAFIGLDERGNTIDWNGWIAFPFFDRATVERVVNDVNAEEGNTTRFRWHGETIIEIRLDVIQDEPLDGGLDFIEPEQVFVPATDRHGGWDIRRLWCIGQQSWVWSEAKEGYQPMLPEA